MNRSSLVGTTIALLRERVGKFSPAGDPRTVDSRTAGHDESGRAVRKSPHIRRSTHSARRFLRACLRGDVQLRLVRPADWLRFVELARDHGLLLYAAGLPELREAPLDVQDGLRAAAHRQLFEQLRIEADLRTVVEALTAADVGWAVVKGLVLSEHWYTDGNRRTFHDLDVVVDPADFRRALDVLYAAGAELLDQNFSLALRQKRAELSLLLPLGTVLDLHWHVMNTPELREQIPLRIREVLRRRIWVPVGDLSVPTFDPADTLLHLCLHTLLSGGGKLLWYQDIQQVAGTGRVDWAELLRRSAQARAGLVVAVALQRTRHLTGVNLPHGLERSASPRGAGWRSLIRTMDVLRPLGGPGTRRLSGRLIVAATRHDTRGSRRALRGILAQQLIAPVLRNRDHPWRHAKRRTGAPPTNPLWQPAEHPADRDRYLNYVTEQP